ncbi:hypothetical protein KCU79_g10304, partial [Aureobasidium melanogenum]
AVIKVNNGTVHITEHHHHHGQQARISDKGAIQKTLDAPKSKKGKNKRKKEKEKEKQEKKAASATCGKCEQKGHFARNCKRCHICKEWGHIRADCPQMANDDDDEEEEEIGETSLDRSLREIAAIPSPQDSSNE